MRRRESAGVDAGTLAPKVPAITAMFWVVKVITTGMGEAASDYLGNLNLVLAVVVGAGGFALTMRWQLRARRYDTVVYWSAVAMVAVFGTMVADAVHVVGLPYTVTTPLYALAVAVVLTLWYRSEGTLSIHSITSARREKFYWLAVLATFALGTAVGDLAAYTLGLGFFGSGVLFAAAIVVPALLWWRGLLNPVVTFWMAYVLTRPLGASFADWFGKPHNVSGGLGYGDGTVTLVALVLGAAGVVWFRFTGSDVQTVVDAQHGPSAGADSEGPEFGLEPAVD